MLGYVRQVLHAPVADNSLLTASLPAATSQSQDPVKDSIAHHNH